MVNDVDPALLRRLAELDPGDARVLSLYLDFDPKSFGTVPARATEITSVLDRAGRAIEEASLPHDARIAARGDLDRARAALLPDGTPLDLDGARALAYFACGPAGLEELVRLPQPVPTGHYLERHPHLTPLLAVAARPTVAVAIVDRHHARIFEGTPDKMTELEREEADRAHRQISEGEVVVYLRQVGDELHRLLAERPYDLFLTSVREELRSAFEDHLPADVAKRSAGELRLDISSARPDDVRRAVTEALERLRERHVAEELQRLRERLGRGERAAAGVQAVRDALEQRRVEVLLYERNRELDGLEDMVEAAVLQDAEVLDVDGHEHPELGPHEGIGAVLRF